MLLMIVILATLSLYQSYTILVYQGGFSLVVAGMQTVELDFLAQRKLTEKCLDTKRVPM
jgi:hypothetical protein